MTRSQPTRLVLSTLAVIVLAGLSAASARAQAGPDATMAAKARPLIVQYKCTMCHKVEGKGGTLAVSLDDVATRRDEAALRRVLENPAPEMPKDAKIKMPKPALKPAEEDTLVAFLKTLKGPAKK
jgi:cytochrome c551/c552